MEPIETCKLLPITYTGSDEDYEYSQYYECTFVEDWGPWKKGEKVQLLSISYIDGLVREWKDEKIVGEVSVKLVPV